MTETQVHIPRKSLTTPRAAAIAGILFTLLYGTGLVLIRLSIPADQTAENAAWLDTNARMVILALNLVPYAGIAFLWFIGVIRDRFGELEDRLFATVFLGSSLLFLASIFVGAALAGGLLSSGWAKSKITKLWLAVCGLSILAAALGYGLAQLLPGANGAAVDAFAAGALLVMLTDSMIPESFEHGGKETGLFLVLGFGVATAMALAQLAG